MPITVNKLHEITGRYLANGYILLNGGESNANQAGETVNTLYITNVMWSCGGANSPYWEINRGANTILNLCGSGVHNYADESMRLELGGDGAANVQISKIGTGPTTLVIQLSKQATKSRTY